MAVTGKQTANLELSQTRVGQASDRVGKLNAGRGDMYARELADFIPVDQTATCYAATLTIDAGDSVSLNLITNLLDLFSDAAVFDYVYGFQIVNHSDAPTNSATATDGIVQIDGNWITSTFGASTAITLDPAGVWSLSNYSNPWDTELSTSDTITLTETTSTDAAYVDVLIVGSYLEGS